MKNTGVNEKALNEFIGTVAALEEKLDALKAHIENHMDVAPEEVNWGARRECKTPPAAHQGSERVRGD